MEEIRIGVYICWCGTNIAMMVDVDDVAEEMKKLPGVVLSKSYKYMCSDPGQDIIIQDIKEHGLNRVVVAACSPRMHELTFRKALEIAGLNPYMFQMANIREQVSWVHTDRANATKKTKSLVAAALKRVNYHEALEKRFVDINPATLIIGGGISGISAALQIADSGKKVYLIEKETQLGGHVRQIHKSFPFFIDASHTVDGLIERAEKSEHIEIFLNCGVDSIKGYVGNFTAMLNNNREIEFGNIIAATGLKTINAGDITNYGYNSFPNVITALEFEQMLKENTILTKEGKVPQHIAVIHCVGSRNTQYKEYCSRVCCMTALKYSNQIKDLLPDSHVYELYADMRAFGNGCEELYAETARRKVLFMMFDQQDGLPEVKKADDHEDFDLLIEMNEKLSGVSIEIPADLIILMTGIEAHEDYKQVSHMIGISADKDGFFIEKHPKLDPVATTTDGVYIVGTCQGPKEIADSVAQAKAAAARVLGTIMKGKVQIESTTAQVNEEVCCGCQLCISMCPYSAVYFNAEKGISAVNEILCKGCGTCGSTCPSGAIKSKHFTDMQILSQINGMMKMELEIKEFIS